MIKREKGITLVSLIITIVLMTIIASTVVYISLDRFEINSLKKMYNDIELLTDKVSMYYLKYGELPKLEIYTLSLPSTLTKNINDSDTYYILDLEAMEGISLNYGREGFKNTNISDDVYVINENSKQIYYIKGIKVQNNIYHTILNDNNILSDNIPPSRPQIKIVSGEQDTDGQYFTEIELEFVPGIEKISNIERTTYSINGGTEIDITTLNNNIYTITSDGTYEIILKSYDSEGNYSEITQSFIKKIISEYTTLEYIESTGTQYIDTGITCNENLKIEVKYSITSFADSRSYIFGAYGLSDSYRAQYSHTSVIFAGFGNMYNNNITAPTANKQYYLVMNNGKFTLDGEEIYDATSAEGKYSSTNIATIVLFANNANGTVSNFGSNKIYECKIYIEEILVRHFVPCKRNSDGAIGLYDKVSKVFYTNSGTGEFVAGPEV